MSRAYRVEVGFDLEREEPLTDEEKTQIARAVHQGMMIHGELPSGVEVVAEEI